ncbi:MAG: SUMF1/EgtB/PvdO family nonheme iron enzyme [Candidatus Eisenbacteria bacterium]|uniref:SUMF1/EgtB/PvdO family nonheme iron enzyme n=1 Tax=Eiseniibacteriota bacterium TaxID=2212470 RepID=A0A937X921_UNCEI|nr:SUMF1/EgtB/PvdO family nonheme iron enzyme [Candidatus Eisenbacteria bacterium]
MRARAAFLFSMMLAGFAYLLLAGGCSEDNPTVEADQTPPAVRIVSPVSTSVYGATIIDSVSVIIRADDDVAIERVELYVILHSETSPHKLGQVAVPDSGGYYSFQWKTVNVSNGSTGEMYAIAYDPSGNRTASVKVPIRVINSKDIGPPVADFGIIPAEGTVETLFRFDASATFDALNAPLDILVRWDFQGDGIWDIDTTDNVKASDQVTHLYAVPDTYRVVMEAFNDYFSLETGIPGRAVKLLVVKPASGIPDPQPEEPFVEIPAGIYPFGALACPTGPCGTDARETLADTLLVRLSNPYFIGKYEVTNALYINFLNRAVEADTVISYDESTYEIRAKRTGRRLLTLEEGMTRVKYSFVDGRFWVEEAFRDHPITGVTWYGAAEYAAFYGLRLPTEVEWEIAARAGVIAPGILYPWDPPTTISGSYANYRNSGDPAEQTSDPIQTMPAGSYAIAASPFGTFDQAGNAAEWVKDWYSAATYQELYSRFLTSGNPPLDPQGPEREASTGEKIIRGGSFNNFPWDLRLTARRASLPGEQANWVGFRTAYIAF